MQIHPLHPALRVACALLLLSAAANPAYAFFGSGTRRKLRDADSAMERGRTAENEQRILDALDEYSRANELYRDVQTDRPGYRADYVATRDAESRARVQTLFARAAAGQLTPPPPESVMPPLDPAQRRQRPPEPLFDDDDEPAIRPDDTGTSTSVPPSDAELARRVQRLLREGAGADAVVLMEGVVEASGDQASVAQRLLFAQALLDRRNYARAEGVLRPLLTSDPDDPSVLSLMAGVHMARGRPVAALRLLDDLVRLYPRHADAYVNLAYVRFAMNPVQHRDEAILYYRHALVLGASRDPRLELELRVDVLR